MRLLVIFLLLTTGNVLGQPALSDAFVRLTATSPWRLKATVPLQFSGHHTQGLVKAGDYFYMTAVEVTEWPERYERPGGKYDRTAGKGKGHLFKFDASGKLLADIVIGEGDRYHPGGLDFDGEYLWIPVCEYRPGGPSNLYKVAVQTLRVTNVLEADDAIGALVYDRNSRTLIGANWGSRDFYKWTGQADGSFRLSSRSANASFYIDYQDCQSTGDGKLICSGLQHFQAGSGQPRFTLGGLELLDAATLRPLHQVPVKLWTPGGAVMTNNPAWLEVIPGGLRASFIPEDDEKSTLYVYEIQWR